MASLNRAAEVVIRKSMKLKDSESCLVITDEKKLDIAKALLDEAEKITRHVKLVQIPVGKVNGEEPPADVAAQMKDYDVLLMPVTKSLSWTKAREEATKSGARAASMPGITKEIMERCVDVPYEDMKERTKGLAAKLKLADNVHITSPGGTDLKLSVKGREWHGCDAGIYDEPGKWGNLPAGEAFVAPVEGTANGVLVVDASMAGVGKLEMPIKIEIKDGYAVGFKGGEEAKKFKAMLDKVGGRKAFNVAELGIGTNPKAKVTGNVLEDEKVLGTCHIAFGSNALFGGKVDVPIHVDGVVRKPAIRAGETLIMENGVLL